MKLINRIKGIYKSINTVYLLNMARHKMKKSLSLRKVKPNTSCIGCGLCCLLNECPNLDIKTKKCKLWPRVDFRCREFPIFKFQLEGGLKNKCRYYWENDKK